MGRKVVYIQGNKTLDIAWPMIWMLKRLQKKKKSNKTHPSDLSNLQRLALADTARRCRAEVKVIGLTPWPADDEPGQHNYTYNMANDLNEEEIDDILHPGQHNYTYNM